MIGWLDLISPLKRSALFSRSFPDHLLCSVAASRPPLQTRGAGDQDSTSSSSCSFISLGLNFNPDR